MPAFIHASDGKFHGENVLDILPIETTPRGVMGREEVDSACLYGTHRASCFSCHTSQDLDECMARIRGLRWLSHGHYQQPWRGAQEPLPAKKYPEHVPRTRFEDWESDKTSGGFKREGQYEPT